MAGDSAALDAQPVVSVAMLGRSLSPLAPLALETRGDQFNPLAKEIRMLSPRICLAPALFVFAK